jgi:hypothetical protein
MRNDDKLPWDIANVEFMPEGQWFMVICGNEKLYVKVKDEDAEAFIRGGMVKAYHIMTANVQKPLYLSALTATEEPWLISGIQCSVIAKVHPVQGQVLDDEIQRCIKGEEKAPELVVPQKKIFRVD